MAETVADRVRKVMDGAGASQAAFGRSIGLSADKLSKSLKGTRRFTSLDLARIAEEGSTTVDWLLSGREPLRPAFAARTTAPIGTDATREELRTLVERFTAAYEVLELLGRQAQLPTLPTLPGLPASPSDGAEVADGPADGTGSSSSGAGLERHVEQGEALAAEALELTGRAGALPVAECETAELVAALERAFGVDVAKAELPRGVDGAAWQADGFRLVLLRAGAAWTRQRFTLAHELGHILARDAQDMLTETRLSPGRQKDLGEVRANVFAANFLMPRAEITAALGGRRPTDEDFRSLVVRFKVSPSALAARLEGLGAIDSEQCARWRTLTAKACHLLAGRGEDFEARAAWAQAHRIPPRPARALYEAYLAGDTTLRTLAAYCETDPEELHAALEPGTAEVFEAASLPLAHAGTETGDLVFQP
ncbi:ImmA/IrrE family metallo-endopeptidase [Streptomyces sp. NA04227]|uniref:helix-turn-helix domain-containing protein n=1 Tax=Streptomyces sp. NA04227 TaxID=2742136 RepID=UPI00158FEB29|nr:ImmA/IrrE family metallo-endopeptidase [Streptomyces sp. NA04227]QKW09381.1 ImmA/IrrE family metallo-endopeptidase [Streptomyces sp. NA04227]